VHHRTSRNVARKGNGGTCPRLPSYPKKFISQIFVDLICDSCIPQYRTPQVEFKTKQKSSSSVRSIVLYPTLKIVPPHACLRGQLSIITIMLTSSYCPPTILPAPNYCSPRACTTLPQQLYIHCVQKKTATHVVDYNSGNSWLIFFIHFISIETGINALQHTYLMA